MNPFKAGISLILYLLVIIIANNIGEIYPKFSTLTGTVSYIAILGIIIGPKKSREQPEKEPTLREIKDEILRKTNIIIR